MSLARAAKGIATGASQAAQRGALPLALRGFASLAATAALAPATGKAAKAGLPPMVGSHRSYVSYLNKGELETGSTRTAAAPQPPSVGVAPSPLSALASRASSGAASAVDSSVSLEDLRARAVGEGAVRAGAQLLAAAARRLGVTVGTLINMIGERFGELLQPNSQAPAHMRKAAQVLAAILHALPEAVTGIPPRAATSSSVLKAEAGEKRDADAVWRELRRKLREKPSAADKDAGGEEDEASSSEAAREKRRAARAKARGIAEGEDADEAESGGKAAAEKEKEKEKEKDGEVEKKSEKSGAKEADKEKEREEEDSGDDRPSTSTRRKRKTKQQRDAEAAEEEELARKGFFGRVEVIQRRLQRQMEEDAERIQDIAERRSGKAKGGKGAKAKDKDGEETAAEDAKEKEGKEKEGSSEKRKRRPGKEDDDEDDSDEAKFEKGARKWLTIGAVAIGVYLVIGAIRSVQERGNSFEDFKRMLGERRVMHVSVTGQREVSATIKESATHTHPSGAYRFTVASAESFQRKFDAACAELGVAQPPAVTYSEEFSLGGILSLAIPLALLLMIGRSMSRQLGGLGGGKGGIFGVGKSSPIIVKDGKSIGVTFKDVAGVDQAKVEIMEFVEFLKHPQRFKKLGAKVPKGALLVGPPGTGKTLLAKATAGEAEVPFFSVSGSDFVEMFAGVGAARVRDLFQKARKQAPAIVFIDEIDAVGRARSNQRSGSHEERENTLNQMLVEMDGFATGEGVIVLAGTNRPELLDKALLRPGRFDRQISIDAPDIKGRKDIFDVHLKRIKLANDKEDVATRMAALTPGMVGADIANVCNEAALIAARGNKDQVELLDFEAAVDRIIGGLAKTTHVMDLEERKRVAYHESGHAIVGWLLEFSDPLLKVTIVPRTSGALGFAQYLPKENALYTVAQLQDRIAMALGGRAAEQVIFNSISSGASDDIKRTSNIALSMVTRLGMSSKLPNMSYDNSENEGFVATKPYSETTAHVVDGEVLRIVNDQYERSVKLLEEHKDKLHALASALLERETLNHDDLVGVLGPRPHSSDAYTRYLDVMKTNRLERERKVAEEAEAKAKQEAAEDEAVAKAAAGKGKGDEKAEEAGEKEEGDKKDSKDKKDKDD